MSIKEYLEAKLKQAKQDLIDCYPEDEDYCAGVADATEVILNWVNQNGRVMTKVDVRGMNWVDANYDIVPTENGEFYQFYEKVNRVTGEKAYMVAKYLNGGEYITEEEAKEILGEHFNR